jgi:hypothetical protein
MRHPRSLVWEPAKGRRVSAQRNSAEPAACPLRRVRPDRIDALCHPPGMLHGYLFVNGFQREFCSRDEGSKQNSAAACVGSGLQIRAEAGLVVSSSNAASETNGESGKQLQPPQPVEGAQGIRTGPSTLLAKSINASVGAALSRYWERFLVQRYPQLSRTIRTAEA